MPNNPKYNKNVKSVFGFGAEVIGSALGFVYNGFDGAVEGNRLGGKAIDAIWVSPDSWQGKKYGSAPGRVTGSAPGKTPKIKYKRKHHGVRSFPNKKF